jgi:hypothetical protein
MEADLDPMLRLTSARNVEVEAVWRLINSAPMGLLIGAGLGSKFEMKYISPNDYQAVSFMRDQADIMPGHIAMTSGLPLSILFTVVLFVVFWRIFVRLDELQEIDRTLAIFSLSLTLDLLLGFNGTNPVTWSAIGYATMRSRELDAVASR